MIGLVGLLGFIVGSFLNHCIDCLPRGESIIGRMAGYWGSGSRRWDGGDEPVNVRSMGVALLNLTLYIGCYQIFNDQWGTLFSFVFVSYLVVIAMIDWDCQMIFDRVLWGLLFFALGFHYVMGTFDVLNLLLGFLSGSIFLLMLALGSDGMGMGDVKFMAVLGVWLGWPLTLLTLLVSFMTGGLVGAALLGFKIKTRKDCIPFGPFLAFGSLISFFWGKRILEWYLS